MEEPKPKLSAVCESQRLASASSEHLPAAIDLCSQSVGEAVNSLQRFLNYSSVIQERLRSAGVFAGEWVRESAGWMVPSAFRNSQSYSLFVQQMLERVVKDLSRIGLGDSDSKSEPHELMDEVLLARKTVGNLLDMTALATFHFSPLTVLAIYSEQAYKAPQTLHQLVANLKQRGIIPRSTMVSSSSDLLLAMQRALEITSTLFEQPPISLTGLSKTIEDTKITLSQTSPHRLLSPGEIDQLWRQMELAARDQRASIWDVSATISVVALNQIQPVDDMGISSLELAGNMYQLQIIDHYWEGLRTIERNGLLPTLRQASSPYFESVWSSFAVDRKSWLDQLKSGDLLKWGWSQVSWPRLGRS